MTIQKVSAAVAQGVVAVSDSKLAWSSRDFGQAQSVGGQRALIAFGQ
jgi:hypothetical protein